MSRELKLPRKGDYFWSDHLNFEPVSGGEPGPEGTYTISPASYAKLKVIVSTPGHNGFKTRAARLADAISKGKYTKRCRGYVMSPAQAERFHCYYHANWDASIFGKLQEPQEN